jgi:type II secretory pathway component PulJ
MKAKKQGFTLVEFLLYLGLLSIFLVILADIFVSIIEVRLASESISSVEQDERFITARLIYDINRAASVTAPASPGDVSSTLALVINGISHTYQLNGGNLELTNNLGADQLNSGEAQISNLSFKRVGNAGGKPTIQLQFTVTSRTERPGAGFEARMASTTAGLR